jgi:hypothetical protein
MPKTVTVRFFQIGKVHRNGPSVRNALDQIVALGQPGARECQLAQGMDCRLERYTPAAGILTGEMTRVRDDDHPSEVHPHGTAQLNVAGAIGEGIAFRYRERDHLLAIQYDPRIMGPGRFIDYMMQMAQPANFTILPKMDRNALASFRARPLRKVKIRIAQPQDLRQVEPAMSSVAQSVRRMGREYAAPSITLELGMGHEGGSLGRDAKRMVEGFIRRAVNDENIKNVRTTSDSGPGVANEEVDLLDALLSVKHTIARMSNDPLQSYRDRARVLERAMNGHV